MQKEGCTRVPEIPFCLFFYFNFLIKINLLLCNQIQQFYFSDHIRLKGQLLLVGLQFSTSSLQLLLTFPAVIL